MSQQLRIDHLRKQALGIDIPLAECPTLNFSEGTEELLGRLQVDMGLSSSFISGQARRHLPLRHTYINIVHPKSPEAKDVWGSLYDCPSVAPTNGEQRLFYPHINLVVDPKNVRPGKVNATWRHELGHLLQPPEVPSYNRPAVRETLRTVGAAAMLLGASEMSEALAYPYDAGVAAMVTGLCVSWIGGQMLLNASGLLSGFNLRERGADIFSLRHRDIKPISLVQAPE